MLRLLKIRDFALVDELLIEFGAGLNLLTGETGSGKSIVVDAIGLLSGTRASPEMVRSGCDAAILEGIFEGVRGDAEASQVLSDAGIPAEEDEVLVRREISSSGRSRSFVNDRLATLALIRSLGARLVDIHGQHDRQELLDLASHLDWLDRYGSHAQAVSGIREIHSSLREMLRRIESMKMDEQERLRRVDVLRFQVQEIRRADPRAGEKDNLETERRVLANREHICSLASEAYGLLYEQEGSVLARIDRLSHLLRELESFDTRWSAHLGAIEEARYRIEDVSYAVRDYTGELDFSPGRIDQVEQRLSDLERLCRKYGSTVDEILLFADKAEAELLQLLSHAELSRELETALASRVSEYLGAAGQLSKKRRADAIRLEKDLRKEFRSLAMERMNLQVCFHPPEEGPTGSRLPGHCGPNGTDRVEFLVSPNQGEEFKPLAKIASGGELSRVMLAIRAVCGCTDPGKTLVFDEVDAGIGGRAAEAVGRRLGEIAQTNQVLCVTHLPQIAAFADRHFSVRKSVVGSRTETSVVCLDLEGRVEELARMLGGETVSGAARRHAREMLERSARGQNADAAVAGRD